MLLPPESPVLPSVPEAFRLYSPRDDRRDHESSASSSSYQGPTPKAVRSKAATQKATSPPVPTPRKEPRWRDGSIGKPARPRVPTYHIADCAANHAKMMATGRNATVAWVSCAHCEIGTSWGPEDKECMDHSSLVYLHGGRLLKMHNDLVVSGANLCIECAGSITIPPGETAVSTTYCQLC